MKEKLINAIITQMTGYYCKEEIYEILLILELKLNDFYMDVLKYYNEEMIEIDVVRSDYFYPITIELKDVYGKFTYKLIIDYKDEFLGYCLCDEDMDSYNEKYGCCGLYCDWSYPTLTVEKIEHLGSKEFDGFQRDLWNEEDKFIEKYFGKDSLYEQENKKKKKKIENDLQYHKNMIDQLEKKLKNL